MWTILKGDTVSALPAYLEQQGSKSTCYCLNFAATVEWCKALMAKANSSREDPPLSWIQGMLQPNQERRWTAQRLVESIQETNDCPDIEIAFSGTCCIFSDRSTISDESSERSSAILEETGASSIGVYDPASVERKIEVHPEASISDLSSSLTLRAFPTDPSAQESLKDDQEVGNAAKAVCPPVAGQSDEHVCDLQAQASSACEGAASLETSAPSNLNVPGRKAASTKGIHYSYRGSSFAIEDLGDSPKRNVTPRTPQRYTFSDSPITNEYPQKSQKATAVLNPSSNPK